MIALCHQTKTPISFWCKRGLNPRSLIQLSETLPVELIFLNLILKILYLDPPLDIFKAQKQENQENK